MKIPLRHNHYQLAGAEDAVMRSEKALLELRGHSASEANNNWIEGASGKVQAAHERNVPYRVLK